MAFQYQMCLSNDINDAVKWYGWMVIGSQTIGIGSWGIVDNLSRHVKCYLYHLGIAFVPYVMPADETGQCLRV